MPWISLISLNTYSILQFVSLDCLKASSTSASLSHIFSDSDIENVGFRDLLDIEKVTEC